jgi:HEPN domain-containing protein
MKQATREWVAKAEEDFLAAVDLARRRKRPLWNTVCFRAQQCVEKYLKARLEEAGLAVPKTHDLEILLDSLLPIEPLWSAFKPALQNLTDFAVAFRYPGNVARKPEAQRAIRDCKGVRREVRLSLGLPV